MLTLAIVFVLVETHSPLLPNLFTGAVVGGAVGALTKASDINLGDPIWETNKRPANRSATARVQGGLARLGYDPGPVDGRPGPKTSGAIRQYQSDHGLLVDGRASLELARHIESKLDGV